MSKRELIEAIRQFNRTVTSEFLERFDVRDLQAYLDRICSVSLPRESARQETPAGDLIVA